MGRGTDQQFSMVSDETGETRYLWLSGQLKAEGGIKSMLYIQLKHQAE